MKSKLKGKKLLWKKLKLNKKLTVFIKRVGVRALEPADIKDLTQ